MPRRLGADVTPPITIAGPCRAIARPFGHNASVSPLSRVGLVFLIGTPRAAFILGVALLAWLAPSLQAAQVTPIEGTWIYAKDPTGAVKSEAIYEGSTITFGPEGKYTFQLGQTAVALQGTWERRGVEGNTVRVHTEYGQERRNDLTLKVRRDRRGAVIGMEVREGDGSTGARYYVPRPK